MMGQGTIVATGSIGYPVGLGEVGALIGAEKVMTMTSTYDHRIIQGAESGRFLQVVEEYLQGEHEFYEGVFTDLGATLGPKPEPPQPPLAAAAAGAAAPAAAPVSSLPTRSSCRPCRPRRRSSRRTARTATSPRGSTRSAPSPRATRRSIPSRSASRPSCMQRIPAKILRIGVPGETLADALPHLRETYCGTIAYEIEHIASHRQRTWLREKIETGAFRKPLTSDEKRALLGRLIKVDSFERFMHKAYLGQKQFSIEGLDMTVPMLDELIQLAATNGAHEVVIGMAHRGRLNVLAHNLGRPYETIFARVRGRLHARGRHHDPAGRHRRRQVPPRRAGHLRGAATASRSSSTSRPTRRTSSSSTRSSRAPRAPRRPTARARTPRATRRPPSPIVLHGDAAFPGQGVVAETLNLQALDGYTVGGTLHLIQNNQVGFTTDPEDSRSTRWASDLAKGFDVPIIHVNADDVEACVSAVRLAFAFRQEFGHDVVIDLIGYRRFGHNEADEPAYTQPEMSAPIKQHKRVRELCADKLVADGVVTQEEAEAPHERDLGPPRRAPPGAQGEDQAAEETGEASSRPASYELDRSPRPDVTTAVVGRAPARRSTRSCSRCPRASPSTRS